MKLNTLIARLKFVVWPAPWGLRSQIRDMLARWRFWDSFEKYSELTKDSPPVREDFYPCLHDNTAETPIDVSYYYQDAWGFEKIVKARPQRHVDVGSHHKFVSLLSKVVPTTMVDLRPLPAHLESLEFKEGTILSLPFPDDSLSSLSSLCVIEHIGLGRYGDPLDANGTAKALAELKRVLKVGGDLYVSVPIDDYSHVFFNAHRAFAEKDLLRLFETLEVVEKRYIFGDYFGDQIQSGFGTGCYHLRKAY